ncbi:MAG: hypothetical protein HC804_08795 [Anaerolineae bacterium]|nr:hypothetical protein [Anaerolineae bacterium]
MERLTIRYLRGEGLNTNQVMRNYSQAISRTLDVQQLALLVAGTFEWNCWRQPLWADAADAAG